MTPSERASRRSQPGRLGAQAHAAITRYPFAAVHRVKLLTCWGNVTYSVDMRLADGTEGRWLLRLHRPQDNGHDMNRSELDGIERLAAAGLDANPA